jgi:hypothetical protein
MRESFDSYISKHCKCLIEICKNCNLGILNGRTLGDSFGKPTSHSKNGSSVVNYIICGQELTQTIESFIVKPPTCLSDHSQLVTWIKRASIHVSLSETTNTQQPKTHKLPQHFIWVNDSMTKFTENLKRGCPQESNIRRPRLKNRFCSNFAQIYLIISENEPYIFLGQMPF